MEEPVLKPRPWALQMIAEQRSWTDCLDRPEAKKFYRVYVPMSDKSRVQDWYQQTEFMPFLTNDDWISAFGYFYFTTEEQAILFRLTIEP